MNGFAEYRHPVLPFRFSDHREPVEIAKMPRAELRVLPGRARRSAVEIVHHHQHADFPVRRDRPVHRRDKGGVIFLHQFAAQKDFERFPAVGFLQLDRNLIATR